MLAWSGYDSEVDGGDEDEEEVVVADLIGFEDKVDEDEDDWKVATANADEDEATDEWISG